MVGALCWITNATFAGWPSDDLVFNTYLLGATSVTGALLFQLGAMCQVRARCRPAAAWRSRA